MGADQNIKSGTVFAPWKFGQVKRPVSTPLIFRYYLTTDPFLAANCLFDPPENTNFCHFSDATFCHADEFDLKNRSL